MLQTRLCPLFCVQGCANNAECSGTFPVCDTDPTSETKGFCFPCTSDAQCGTVAPICVTSNTAANKGACMVCHSLQSHLYFVLWSLILSAWHCLQMSNPPLLHSASPCMCRTGTLAGLCHYYTVLSAGHWYTGGGGNPIRVTLTLHTCDKAQNKK